MHLRRVIVAALLAVALVFATAPPARAAPDPAWYLVRTGDNLTIIARTFGTTVDRLRRDNGLRGDTIQPGQRIEMSQPLVLSSRPRWQPPYLGHRRVVSGFGPYEQDRIILPRTGVAVALDVGSEVFVPATGVLRFLAPMEDLGVLAIIEHPGGHHTVLWPLDLLSVPWQTGQCVIRGDVLGHLAPPPEVPLEPYLHIELRRDSKAVPPDRLLR